MGLIYSKSIPNELSERYTQLFKIINNLSYHIEVKKYLLNEEISKLYTFKISDTFTYSIFPKNNEIIQLFGLFSISENNYVFIKILHFKIYGFDIRENYISILSNKHQIIAINILDVYNEIINTLDNQNLHVEVKKHIINSCLDKLKPYEIYGSCSKIIFLSDINTVLISGIFATLPPNEYCYMHITNLNTNDSNEYNKYIYYFKINEKSKPIEVDCIDDNLNKGISIPSLNIIYDENGVPIPPSLQIHIQYDENGIPIPPPLPPI